MSDSSPESCDVVYPFPVSYMCVGVCGRMRECRSVNVCVDVSVQGNRVVRLCQCARKSIVNCARQSVTVRCNKHTQIVASSSWPMCA